MAFRFTEEDFKRYVKMDEHGGRHIWHELQDRFESEFGVSFSSTPYIVKTRKHSSLLDNLSNTMQPIVFDGLHTTYFLKDPKLKEHKKIVRTHNIEHEYYHHLSKTTDSAKDSVFFTNVCWTAHLILF